MTLPVAVVVTADTVPLDGEQPGRLLGCLDVVSPECIEGWAQDEAHPDEPVSLRVLDNGIVIGQVLADRFREDLHQAGVGAGRHGFSLIVRDGLSPLVRHVIQVQRVSDNKELPESPKVLESVEASRAIPAALLVLPSAAGAEADAQCRWRGCVDRANREVIAGWAHDSFDSQTPVALQILDNGTPIARVLANRYRADLMAAGIGDGRHGFELRIPGALSPLLRHVIQVRREADGGELDDSPTIIEPATCFEPALQAAVSRAVASLGVDAEQRRVLSFLLTQIDRLLQVRADAEGQRESRLAYYQFRRRWGPMLPRAEGEAAEAPVIVPDPGRRALVIDDEMPQAGRNAGSQAILSHMQALQQLGYVVSFVAAAGIACGDAAADALGSVGIRCCRAPFYSSVEDVLRRQAHCFDVVYLHRVSNATKYLALVREYFPKARVLYSVADLHHVRLARQGSLEGRPELLAQSRQQRLAECTAAWAADAVLTHSAVEVELLRQAVPDANVHLVPWAVPLRPTKQPLAKRFGLAFIGAYAHPPNVDAAHFLAEAIMPRVWQRDPSIECLLVGSQMPQDIKRLARPGLIPIGQVQDLAEVFERVRLTVAPLRYGAGVKGKVLESLAAGVPCVMSEMAAEGLVLPAALQRLVARDEAALAQLICQLHADATANSSAAAAGLALMQQAFTSEAIASALKRAISTKCPAAASPAGGALRPAGG